MITEAENDDRIMTAALNAEEAFQASARLFKIHKSAYGGVVVRVVEYPEPPGDPIDFGKPVNPEASIKYWDFGDETMAKDFIRLQCWKAAVRRTLSTGPLNIQQRASAGDRDA